MGSTQAPVALRTDDIDLRRGIVAGLVAIGVIGLVAHVATALVTVTALSPRT